MSFEENEILNKLNEIGYSRLPNGWNLKRIEDVCSQMKDAPFGAKLKSKDYIDYGIPVVQGRNIKNNKFEWNNKLYTSEEKKDELKNHLCYEGELVFPKVGTIGGCAILPKIDGQGEYVLSTNMMKIKANSAISDNKYIYYYFSNPLIQRIIKQRSTSSVQPVFNFTSLKKFPIVVPSLAEQKSVVAVLSSLDDKIELNTTINKNLEEMAQALFKRWFIDFEFPNENGEPYKSSGGEFEESELGLIPKGWKVGIATDVFDVASGGTPKTGKTEFWNGDIPFFTPKDSSNSFFVINTEKYITEEGLANCNSKLYPPNTIFITARGTVGKVMLAGCSMAMNQSCYALIAKEGYNQNFAFFLISSLVDILKQNASGAVFDAITVSTFRSLKTVVPPSILTSKFNQLIESIQFKILANVVENHNLTATRDTLLPKLMSGEIRVPLDEQELVISE